MTPRPELLERDAEAALLAGLAGRARAGGGSCVVVAGEAGIGKTALLGRVDALAGMRVLRATAGELEDDVPFGVVRDVLGSIAPREDAAPSGSAALCAPVFAPGAAAVTEAGAVLHGLYWLVADVAEREPLALVVDDVQWADPSSVRFLGYLARRAADLPCLLVLGLRAGPRTRLRADVQALVEDAASHRIDLAPLSAAAVSALVAARLEAPIEPAFAGACFTATGGNPLLCVAMATELARAGVRGRAYETTEVERIGGTGAAEAVRRRVARCGPAAERFALGAAVLGRSATYRLVRAVAELAAADAAEALDALVADGVLEDERPLAFAHPILRRAVLDDASRAVLARWHARAAQLLAADGFEERAAHHLRLAEPLGDPAGVALLRRAAQLAAGRGASDVAVAYLARALEEPPPPELRAELLYELGVAETRAGLSTAVTHLERARDQATDPDLQIRVAGTLGDVQMWAGRWGDAVSSLERGLAAANRTAAATVLHGQLLRAAVGSASVRRLTHDRLAALRVPPASGLDRYALGFLAVELSMTTGPVERVAELATRALGGGDLLDGQAEGLQELVGIALALADEPAASIGAFDAAIAHARVRGSVMGSARASALRGWALLRFGRPAEAEADVTELLALQDGIVVNAAAAPMAVSTLIGAALERRGVEAAAEAVQRFAHVEADPDLAGAQALPVARAQVALAELRPGAALTELEVSRRWEEAFGGTSVGFAPWRPVAITAHLLLDDHPSARALATEQTALAAAFGGPTARGLALHSAGLVDANPGVLTEAVAVLRGSPARSALVRALIDLGAALRGARQVVAARVPLREALDLSLAAGALGLAERAREELLAAGARPRRVRSTGVHALTPAERRACRLAAQGLTNRQIAQASFIAPRTVEMHLSNAYRKLGLTGREQLHALASEL